MRNRTQEHIEEQAEIPITAPAFQAATLVIAEYLLTIIPPTHRVVMGPRIHPVYFLA